MPSTTSRNEWLARLGAEHAAGLPEGLRAEVERFRDAPPAAGCLLLQGLPVGTLPATPPTPTALATGTDAIASEVLLLAVATVLGEPVGYQPEHNGDIVQNIVPVPSAAGRQTSTSSAVDLMFHTEAAFHPHRPKFLLLFCLRGDPQARTTVASVHEALPHLPGDVVDTLFEPRFRCAVDESYLDGRSNVLGPLTPVLSGDREHPAPGAMRPGAMRPGMMRMVFDEDLMVGVDDDAQAALGALGRALAAHHQSVVLAPGDLLVIDNDLVVHGRSPFPARFDGTDRWLQRAFVVRDLAASAAERDGRVITTVFGV